MNVSTKFRFEKTVRVDYIGLLIGIVLCLCYPVNLFAGVSENSIVNMPVKEVTVFKDGHVYVLHEGEVLTNDQGHVTLDYLPNPIIGTFWPYSADPNVKLTHVVAGACDVEVDRTASTIAELVKGNIGSKVLIGEINKQPYKATILRVLAQSTADKNGIVLLQVDDVVRAVPVGKINELTFLGKYKSDIVEEKTRNVMTLKLDWPEQAIQKTAKAGMVYVQRGIRWIPSYRFELDGEGNAVVKLQATLVNELIDLKDVKTHLVIGVPTFKFKETPDPFSLQKTFARLSNAFPNANQTTYAFSNALMSQMRARTGEYAARPARDEGAVGLAPELQGHDKNEDLFVFTVDHITLKKGECMVVPIAQFTLKYRDIYSLNLPFAPPREVRRNFNSTRQAELARLFHAPKAMHKIRFVNDSEFPITTAPALIFCNGRVIAQGMTTYTARGASCDMELTAAVDITVKVNDKMDDGKRDTEDWDGHRYYKKKLSGKIHLANFTAKNISLEIHRSVMGRIEDADHDGDIQHFGRNEMTWSEDIYPYWWNWYSWPYWWYHFNEYGQIKWVVELKPNETIDLNYNWYYYWR